MTMKQYIGIGVGLLLTVGCGSDEKMDTPTLQPEVTAIPIRCSVQQVNGMQDTRALIEDDATLQTACEGTTKEAIGIYGSCTSNSGGTATTVFNNTALVYDVSVGTNDEVNGINWNYADEQYWAKDATYIFRACYPQNALNGTSENLSGTYDTQTTQDDLMVAYATENTATSIPNYVTLTMNHTLAAVKFIVKSEDGSTMTLQSLSLSGLYTRGNFTYSSTVAPTVNDWTQLANNASSYGWSGSLSFSSTETVVKSYTVPSALGSSYADDGFILVIPQTNVKPVLDLSTAQKDYTDIDLRRQDGNGNKIATDFLPGMKYTYTITVSPTQLKLTLSIKAWNKRESSYDITF